ncbi:alpha/beta hydrolase family protein [Cellvibrio japonicus]|uniref:Putative lipoprotein n=1 Tax=Cellvibrio japonicus (strain Ueda107) TaxID=498211 RepID=B3PFB5_CELJU|nr:DUF2974 domain-containing protein [Cellvibrio japonicus]ACE84407.1 putative lipoprotein [Cellvibrio japonicus Ueda107]QEI13663.1 DUF2974 domain-containing protein [Cellvibrio japonicus]QEI17236.1 DUF2974 domain-containing protein [Cellvibrio japonicus]QEI20814.1 DUF2974 domain-containing protein [Cellvibrio japonicus]
MKNALVIFTALFVMQGCTWFSKIKQTGTDHCSGWSDQVRSLADEAWLYAQLSQNVYADNDDFMLRDTVRLIEEFDRKDINFYSALYQDTATGTYSFIFRGTDSFEDFRTGNNPFEQIQNKIALSIVESKTKEYSLDSFVVAGHSLGGGIATHVSLNIQGATLYTFNGSPVFKKSNVKFNNQRDSIVERGEVLKIVRLLAREPDQIYTSIECTSGNAIEEHSIKKLATCLTRISAANDNEQALSSLKINNIDKKWCKES